MRIVFFGSGAFGLPTLKRLHSMCDVRCVVSQPDRPAGRQRTLSPTPISEEAMQLGLPLERVANVNEAPWVERLGAIEADAWVVIAFGQKLSAALLDGRFAINLHASLLPRWRGAAPIHHAIMAGDSCTGISVITLDQVMDGGLVLEQILQPIAPTDTTGRLHDVLAELGPDAVGRVLEAHTHSGSKGQRQDPKLVTLAPRLARSDAVLDLEGDCVTQRNCINGLSPWPGCRLLVDGVELRVLQAGPSPEGAHSPPGILSPEGILGLGNGSVQLLEVQGVGGRVLSFDTWANGRRFKAPVPVDVPK